MAAAAAAATSFSSSSSFSSSTGVNQTATFELLGFVSSETTELAPASRTGAVFLFTELDTCLSPTFASFSLGFYFLLVLGLFFS
jgi:hypothetical protein